MSNAPLMPKATAVWLVENTSLTFDQIAEFCKLHPLEVKGIADGEVASGIRGHDPITSGQLTREEIERGEKNSSYQLKLAVTKVRLPEAKRHRGPRYTPLSRRQDRPNAILWLVRNHPELKDAQIMRLAGTTKSTIARDPRPHPLEFGGADAAGPGDARPVLADRPRFRGRSARPRIVPLWSRITARRWRRPRRRPSRIITSRPRMRKCSDRARRRLRSRKTISTSIPSSPSSRISRPRNERDARSSMRLAPARRFRSERDAELTRGVFRLACEAKNKGTRWLRSVFSASIPACAIPAGA